MAGLPAAFQPTAFQNNAFQTGTSASTTIFGPNVNTTLTNVPAKTFTRKHYKDELTKIREEAIAVAALLQDLDDKQRADLAYENAKNQYDEDEATLFGSFTEGAHSKLTESKAKLDELRKARDHQYFMEIVNKEWAKHGKNKKH